MDPRDLAEAGAIGRLTRALMDVVRDAFDRRRQMEELAALDPRDLDRIQAEIGCDRYELAALVRHTADPRPLLDQMILRLGLEWRFMFAAPVQVRELERRCGACRARGTCRSWLRAGVNDDAYKRFCPNAANFETLAAPR